MEEGKQVQQRLWVVELCAMSSVWALLEKKRATRRRQAESSDPSSASSSARAMALDELRADEEVDGVEQQEELELDAVRALLALVQRINAEILAQLWAPAAAASSLEGRSDADRMAVFVLSLFCSFPVCCLSPCPLPSTHALTRTHARTSSW